MRNPRLVCLAVLALLGSGGAACSEDDQAPPVKGPRFEDLVPGQVNVIKPGGDTICARGGEYAFFVIPGVRDKVIIEFQGGGACWDQATCGFASDLFRESVNIEDHTKKLSEVAGWYDHRHPQHPMPEWTHVYLPYCTGDIHWGDSVKTYPANNGTTYTIHHKGAVNVRAALEWVYAQIPRPAKAFVTGCSAGGYGSIWWAPHVQNHYSKTTVYHFSDSAAGVITDDFFTRSFPSWNTEPSWAQFLGPFSQATSLSNVYKMVTAYYPSNLFSQYNTVLDANQALYYIVMGGKDAAEWSGKMKASIATIQGAAPNFRAYLAGGEQHCIIPAPNFYASEANGVKLTEWLSSIAADKPVDNVSCSECNGP